MTLAGVPDSPRAPKPTVSLNLLSSVLSGFLDSGVNILPLVLFSRILEYALDRRACLAKIPKFTNPGLVIV